MTSLGRSPPWERLALLCKVSCFISLHTDPTGTFKSPFLSFTHFTVHPHLAGRSGHGTHAPRSLTHLSSPHLPPGTQTAACV